MPVFTKCSITSFVDFLEADVTTNPKMSDKEFQAFTPICQIDVEPVLPDSAAKEADLSMPVDQEVAEVEKSQLQVVKLKKEILII